MQMLLLREGILDAEGINRLEKKVDEEVRHAAEHALRAAPPPPHKPEILKHVYSEHYDPTRAELQTTPAPPAEKAQERTMADLINLCLKDEMRRDPAHPHLRRGRGRLLPRGLSARRLGQRQRRRLQAHLRAPVRIRRRPRLQLPACRGQHRRPRRGHGRARH